MTSTMSKKIIVFVLVMALGLSSGLSSVFADQNDNASDNTQPSGEQTEQTTQTENQKNETENQQNDQKAKASIKIEKISRNNGLAKGAVVKLTVTYNNVESGKQSVLWKSSKRSVAVINSRGVLKTKKKGRCIITAVLRSDRSVKSSISIRVGKKAKSVTINPIYAMNPGDVRKITAKVRPSRAINREVYWKSSNSSIAEIDPNGKITAKKPGKVVITATARDGSKKKSRCNVYVYEKVNTKRTKQIAHRGLLTDAPENTAKAYMLAGEKGFWGAECDVWETMHDANGKFDIILNHDDTLDRMTDYSGKAGDYTAEEIKQIRVTNGNNAGEANEGICNLDKFLDICKKYHMVPFVEIKGNAISDEGVMKIIDTLKKKHMLKSVWICSLEMESLSRAMKYAKKKYKVKLKTNYMIYKAKSGKAVLSRIKKAHAKKVKGAWVYPKYINKKVYKRLRKYKMAFFAGTFETTKKDKDIYEYTVNEMKVKAAFVNGMMNKK